MITLVRERTDEQGTPGWLSLGPWTAHSLELPWLNNQPNISCVPAGIYDMEMVKTRNPIGGRSHLYLIKNVPQRSGILAHAGTFAGDKSKGFKTSVLGCILMGYAMGIYQNQRAIFHTRRAIGDFMNITGGKPTKIHIINAWEKAA